MELAAWEKGGPNDPLVVFDELREVLTLVKEELSPWGWQDYAMEFRERQKADKKLHALNGLPGSGAEPKDGVVKETPLYQERLDKMLLVEHLKKKLMTAHGEFVESSELLLKAHAWLVKEGLLADRFVVSITHVPPAKSERMDLLQSALQKSRKETRDLREAFEDFRIQIRIKREKYCNKVSVNQKIAIRRQLCDQAVVSWCYAAQRSTAQRLAAVRRVQEARVVSLECGYAARTEELEESQRQWDEEKMALTEDRDKFKKLYQRMVKAHEQAMEDLKKSEGSADDLKKMVQVLSIEKSRLVAQVEELEEDKKRMTKQLVELRDQVAQQKKEIRRYGAMIRGSEEVIVEARAENQRLEDIVSDVESKLKEVALVEATLRDQLFVSQGEVRAVSSRVVRGLGELEEERRLRRTIENERDRLLALQRHLERQLVRVVNEVEETIESVMERARRELEEFRNSELAKVKEEFRRKTEAILRRNAQLEKEIAVADSLAPHLNVLNPLVVDEQRMCPSCKKAIVFEGIMEQKEPLFSPTGGKNGPGGYPEAPT